MGDVGGLGDYAAALGAAQQLVPNWQAGDIQNAKLQALRADTQNQNITTQLAQQKAATADARQSSFQAALAGMKRTPDGYRTVAAQFPEFHDALENAAKGLDGEKRQSLVKYLAPISSQISSGQYEDAAKAVKRHMDADVAAGGQADEDDQHLYDELMSGNPTRQKAAGGVAFSLLTQLNPDTAAKNVGDRGTAKVVGYGDALIGPNGEKLYQAPDAPFTMSEGQTRFSNSAGGGDRPSSGGRADGSFDNFHKNFLGPIEGGYADRDGASGAPVNYGVNQKFNPDINVKNLTADGAKEILRDRYWKPSGAASLPPGLAEVQMDTAVNMGVGTAKRLLKASGGNVEKYLQLREARYRSIGGKDLGTWLNRNNSLRQYVGMQDGSAPAQGSGPQAVASVAPGAKPQFQMLSPQEASGMGLDPNVKYQRSPTGQITALGGQSKAQLKQIPTKGVGEMQENIATLKQIDGAIAEVKRRPSSIGPGTGFLGDTVTQFNDPDGTATRASVGKIGGQIIHDVSGAAVTISEEPRFKPYVPTVTDRPEVALEKLKKLRSLAMGNLSEQRDFYSEDNGYRPYKSRYLDGGGQQQSAPVRVKSIQQARALSPGTKFITPDGRMKVR